jgi:adenylate cyclase
MPGNGTPEPAVRGGDATRTGRSAPEAHRRLAAVIAADAVGYTRRIQLEPMRAYRALVESRILMTRAVESHGGCVVGMPGDFFLITFPNCAQAVDTAVQFQREIGSRNDTVDPGDQLDFRVGVGLGEIIETEGDIHGHAVNVAARLQTIALPGSIVVEDQVATELAHRNDLELRDLGLRELKNISEPIRAFAIGGPALGPRYAADRVLPTLNITEAPPPTRATVVIGPFRGSEAETQLIAQGIEEELITNLAQLSGSLDVRTKTPDDVAISMSDWYRIAGSVRTVKTVVSVRARLERVRESKALWAETFKYRLEDNFDLTEVVARRVVEALQVRVTEGIQARDWSVRTTNTQSWMLFLRGHEHERMYRREGHVEARHLYQQAIELDPRYVVAIVAQAFCYLDEARLGWTGDNETSIAAATALAEQAEAIEPDFPDLHALKAWIALARSDAASAIAEGCKSVELAPRNAELRGYLASLYDTLGYFDEAIESYLIAMRLSPHYAVWISSNLALTCCVTNRLAEAERLYRQVLAQQPDYVRAHIGLVVVLTRLSRLKAAHDMAATVRQLDPVFRADDWARNQPYLDAGILQAFVSDLKQAGLR